MYARVNFKTVVVYCEELFWEFCVGSSFPFFWAFVFDVTELFLH